MTFEPILRSATAALPKLRAVLAARDAAALERLRAPTASSRTTAPRVMKKTATKKTATKKTATKQPRRRGASR
jgi:hypothetical protein